jgi:hypothetical protein
MVEYPVRTPPLYFAISAVLLVIAIPSAVVSVLALASGRWLDAAIALALAIVPVIYLATTGEYRVGRAAFRISSERIEIPGLRGEAVVFETRGLVVHVKRVVVRYSFALVPVADVERGFVIELASGSARRRLSTLTLVEPEHTAWLLEDLERVCRGEEPFGPHRRPPPPPKAPDHYDAELERELAALD